MFEPYVNYQQQEFVARPAPPPPNTHPKLKRDQPVLDHPKLIEKTFFHQAAHFTALVTSLGSWHFGLNSSFHFSAISTQLNLQRHSLLH